MRIADVKLDNPVISAPMAGVTDRAFRILAKEAGCGLVYTEMVSDQALIYGNSKTDIILNINNEKGPVSVQIFGSDPHYMEQAAALVAKKSPEIIDINMGCPTPKIVKNGEGAALMKNPKLALDIVKAVVTTVNIPVTVKIRMGWDEDHINAVEMAVMLENAGVSAIAVHGRTREQFYSGKARWDIISQVKKAVSVPVIGNGDITKPEDAKRMLEETGCDGVMVGRAAMGNPWIFKRIIHYLETNVILPLPNPEERVNTALRHLELLTQYKGEHIGVREMRKHAAWYLKGLPKAARLRQVLNYAGSKEEMADILKTVLVKSAAG